MHNRACYITYKLSIGLEPTPTEFPPDWWQKASSIFTEGRKQLQTGSMGMQKPKNPYDDFFGVDLLMVLEWAA